ncbi:MAG: 50S ribosomal protein L6 [Desulfobulbaceae bacterium]|nr:50S ribosomal protein L6 [Desulfobulbaceae bacterium]
MSRIGKQPIPLPDGVKVEVDGTRIKVSGKKGTLEREVRPEVRVKVEDNQVICEPLGTSKQVMAFWGLTRTLIYNMVCGVSEGFTRVLNVEGVGYRASVSGSTLTLNVGYSNPVLFPLPAGISGEVGKDNAITLQGIDKELIGLTAARIRAVRKPEPYKGKGIRYAGEYVARKVGKAGGVKK